MKKKKDEVFDAWFEQAKEAHKNGVTLTNFVLNAHPDNREIARKAFIALRKSQG